MTNETPDVAYESIPGDSCGSQNATGLPASCIQNPPCNPRGCPSQPALGGSNCQCHRYMLWQRIVTGSEMPTYQHPTLSLTRGLSRHATDSQNQANSGTRLGRSNSCRARPQTESACRPQLYVEMVFTRVMHLNATKDYPSHLAPYLRSTLEKINPTGGIVFALQRHQLAHDDA